MIKYMYVTYRLGKGNSLFKGISDNLLTLRSTSSGRSYLDFHERKHRVSTSFPGLVALVSTSFPGLVALYLADFPGLVALYLADFPGLVVLYLADLWILHQPDRALRHPIFNLQAMHLRQQCCDVTGSAAPLQ